MALFIALAVVLEITCTFKTGYLKVAFKFLAVFASATYYGPIFAGVVGVIADVVNHFVHPTGAFMPQISAIEFFYGLLYGIMFYKKKYSRRKNILMIFLCVMMSVGIINLLITSFVLAPVFSMTFTNMMAVRIVPALINFAVQFVGIYVVQTAINRIKNR